MKRALRQDTTGQNGASDGAEPRSDIDLYQALLRARAPSFSELQAEYATLWTEMVIDERKIGEIDRIVNAIRTHQTRYAAVEQTTGVPWHVIATIHYLEADLDFNTHLHNGDPLTARTVHVPAGRPLTGSPPFSWEESAVDALNYDGLSSNHDWSLEHTAYVLEAFNGWGYRLNHPEVKSPYLWSFSSLYSRGKYVGDHHWSSAAVSDQCGAMVAISRMQQLNVIPPTPLSPQTRSFIHHRPMTLPNDLPGALAYQSLRSSSVEYTGVKLPDRNFPDRFLIVEDDRSFHSFRNQDLLREDTAGAGLVRVWVRAGATAWRSSVTETVTKPVAAQIPVDMEDIAPPAMIEVPGMPRPATEADYQRRLAMDVGRQTIAAAASLYSGGCVGGDRYTNNCAHFLSDAFIRAGFSELRQPNSCITARCDTPAHRVIRARDMWCWFKAKATQTASELQRNTGLWAVFQLDESVYWGGHVVIVDTDSWTYHGTASHWNWTQYAYKW
jgi:lysozyme family protein